MHPQGLDIQRCLYFHYKITANGYKTLVTQIYFKDDPTSASESIESCRIINFKKDRINVYKGTADIHIESN